MPRSGRNYVSIEAPIMKVQGAYIWMDRYWPEDLFKWMRQEKMVFTEIKMKTNKNSLVEQNKIFFMICFSIFKEN